MSVDPTQARERLTEIGAWLAEVRETWPSAHPLVAELVGIATEALAEVDRLTARVAELERERDAARSLLGDCFVLAGGETDGDGWEHTWGRAVVEVEAMREDHEASFSAIVARIAELEQARARDIGAIVGWLRSEGPGSPADVYGSAVGGNEWTTAADAIERGDWHDGVLPADPRDARIAALEADKADAIAERDHIKLCLDIQNRPWIAGPPSVSSDDHDSEDDAVRVRAAYLRIAMWTFCAIAANHPAPNHLAINMPSDGLPDDAPEVMRNLTGWTLEIAAVKPGMKGPSQMRVEAQERIAALESAARAVLSLTGDETMEEADAVMDALEDVVDAE